jgi:hypothetical protein
VIYGCWNVELIPLPFVVFHPIYGFVHSLSPQFLIQYLVAACFRCFIITANEGSCQKTEEGGVSQVRRSAVWNQTQKHVDFRSGFTLGHTRDFGQRSFTDSITPKPSAPDAGSRLRPTCNFTFPPESIAKYKVNYKVGAPGRLCQEWCFSQGSGASRVSQLNTNLQCACWRSCVAGSGHKCSATTEIRATTFST